MTNDIFSDAREWVLAATVTLGLLDKLNSEISTRITVGPTRDPAHGDITTNAAMVLGTYHNKDKRVAAAELAGQLSTRDEIASAEAAGPGFINIRLNSEILRAVLPTVLANGAGYGDSRVGARVTVNIEYVSANPTGPVHVGHCRGAVVGDALANLLTKAGFAVTKEYYVNDAGAQVAALGWAVYWRYLQAIGTQLIETEYADAVPGGLQYRGDYLVPVGQALAAAHGVSLAGPNATAAPPELWLDTVRDFAVNEMMAQIRIDLGRLGVVPDVFTSERKLLESGVVDEVIDRLQADGLIYEGVLEPPKGKMPDDWEPRAQTLFRATRFGDDLDRPLRKSDGSNTYFANDIAYHADKLGRGAAILIDVLGADHGGYVSRMKAAVRAISCGSASLDVVLCQIVHVVKGGEVVKMSKRAGTYVALGDLIDEVGADAVRFTMLTRKSDAQMEFDLDAVVAQTRDNPVFYVQYAHARCRSVLRAAAEMFGAEAIADAALAQAPLDSLGNAAEMALIRRIAAWPRHVEAAASAREPHRIAFFLYDLAADFHMLWNRGRDDSTLRFLRPEFAVESLAKLALVSATAMVIRSGLAVMGVTPVEEMR